MATDAAEEGRRWQEAELRRKDETFAAAEEKHRRQVPVLNIRVLLDLIEVIMTLNAFGYVNLFRDGGHRDIFGETLSAVKSQSQVSF